MARRMLSDERWSKLRAIMHEHGIYRKRHLRKTIEGILYRMRVGCPWRDLPPHLDDGNQYIKRLIAGLLTIN